MSEDSTYNGWTNYETWAVGLYLDGNYDGAWTYQAVLELARDVVGAGTQTKLYALEGALKNFVEESLPDLGASLGADLLGAAVDEVNWRELAEAKLAEITENAR